MTLPEHDGVLLGEVMLPFEDRQHGALISAWRDLVVGKGNFSLGEGKFSLGEGKFSLGEGNSPLGEGKFSLGEGNSPLGEGNSPLGEGNSPLGEGKFSLGEGKFSLENGFSGLQKGEFWRNLAFFAKKHGWDPGNPIFKAIISTGIWIFRFFGGSGKGGGHF